MHLIYHGGEPCHLTVARVPLLPALTRYCVSQAAEKDLFQKFVLNDESKGEYKFAGFRRII
jgi:hypothetical protein